MSGSVVAMTGEELEQAAAEAKRLMEESSGQMAIDMTLDSERDMKDNLNTIIEFRLQTLLKESPPPSDVRNRHEAYGIAAENFCQVNASVKKIHIPANLFDHVGRPQPARSGGSRLPAE